MKNVLILQFLWGVLIARGTHAEHHFQDYSNYVRNDVFRTPAFFAPSSINSQESPVKSKNIPKYIEIEQDDSEVVGDTNGSINSDFRNVSEDDDDTTQCVIKKGQKHNLILIKGKEKPIIYVFPKGSEEDSSKDVFEKENIQKSKPPVIFYVPYSSNAESENLEDKRKVQCEQSTGAKCKDNKRIEQEIVSVTEKSCLNSDRRNAKRGYRYRSGARSRLSS